MRIIDADALKETFDPEHYYDWYTPSILENIDNAPTIDAVKIVRCVRCVHSELPDYMLLKYGMKKILKCTNKKSPCNSSIVRYMDFCPYGEGEKNDGF